MIYILQMYVLYNAVEQYYIFNFQDYSHRFFIWHEWIQVPFLGQTFVQLIQIIQANGPLTAENAFDYFTTSMFYDKQSNNQVLRMQTIFTGEPLLNEAEELKSVHLLPTCSSAKTVQTFHWR